MHAPASPSAHLRSLQGCHLLLICIVAAAGLPAAPAARGSAPAAQQRGRKRDTLLPGHRLVAHYVHGGAQRHSQQRFRPWGLQQRLLEVDGVAARIGRVAEAQDERVTCSKGAGGGEACAAGIE